MGRIQWSKETGEGSRVHPVAWQRRMAVKGPRAFYLHSLIRDREPDRDS